MLALLFSFDVGHRSLAHYVHLFTQLLPERGYHLITLTLLVFNRFGEFIMTSIRFLVEELKLLIHIFDLLSLLKDQISNLIDSLILMLRGLLYPVRHEAGDFLFEIRCEILRYEAENLFFKRIRSQLHIIRGVPLLSLKLRVELLDKFLLQVLNLKRDLTV